MKFKHKDHINLSDERREYLVQKNQRMSIAASIFFIAIGVQQLILEIFNKTLPSGIHALETFLLPVLFILILLQGREYVKYKLAPADEYEQRQDMASKAKAFNFLSTGVFFIIFLFPQNWAIPLLYILVGYSWLLASKDSINELTE